MADRAWPGSPRDLFVDDEPYHVLTPRQNLKRVLSQVRETGYTFYVGIEPEHFLVTRGDDGSISVWDPNDIDNLAKACYDFKGIANVVDYLRDMMDGMARLGWDPYQSDHEDANGQYEINFGYADALITADRYTFFKMMTSQYAQKYGAIATHMAKPFTDRTGSGGHIHIHLADASTDENVFVDEDDATGLGLSELARHFIGGIFAHAPALCAVMSPTVNCYKEAAGGLGAHGVALGVPVDAGVRLLRRQQPDADDPHSRPGASRGPDDVVGLQPVPGAGRLRHGGTRRHQEPA